jgi:hypothetical protein
MWFATICPRLLPWIYPPVALRKTIQTRATGMAREYLIEFLSEIDIVQPSQ